MKLLTSAHYEENGDYFSTYKSPNEFFVVIVTLE